MAQLTPTDRLGTVLADRYRIDEILGQGGMGVVFGATHTWTGRPLALKVLRPHLVEEVDVVRRFLQEARAAATLRHPNVIDVLDMGRAEDGTVFIALERLDGRTLGALLGTQAPLSVERTAGMLLPILDALGAAHAAEIVHRDVKPENIFLSRGQPSGCVPKLLDFGVAKLRLAPEQGATGTGVVVGTPEYMAPEQAMAKDAIGPPADVWAMGAVFHECLVGGPPHGRDTPAAVLVRLLTEQVRSFAQSRPELPAPVAAVLDRALARTPEARFVDGRAFADALRRALADAGIVPATPGQADLGDARHAVPGAALPGGTDATPWASVARPAEAPPRTTPGAALRVTTVRPYGARIRGRVFPLLESAGLVIDPGDVIPAGTPDAQAVDRVLASANRVLLVPFHGHQDALSRTVHGIDFLRELHRARPSFPWIVLMPVSTFGRAALTLALEAQGDTRVPDVVRRSLLVLGEDELETPGISDRVRRHVRDAAR